MGGCLNILTSYSSGGYDADANAFFNANTGLSTTIKDATNTLVLGLKSNSLWSKLYFFHPILGSSSTAQKWNLKNPLDTDAAFRLVFSGTITHGTNTITGNGTNGYANTYFNDNTAGVSTGSFTFGRYSTTNSISTAVDMGAVKSSPVTYNQLRPRYSSTEDFFNAYDDSNFYGNYLTSSAGLIAVTRTSSTEQKAYQNGSLVATRSAFSATALTNYNMFLMCRNADGSAANFSNRTYTMFFAASGFDATDHTNFNNLITTFNAAISR